ncbi:hypothetical protein N7470_005130 [Penicillium chermesinum]|nr:hypothetical protein N7470_005130 [Penicillium chermesinum]
MSVRVLCGKKPGKLLHSRVQIVVKLLKLRTSAAETAEKRHRKQSEASEEDVIAAVEVSESAQEQNEQEEKDKEQEQDENKENAESPQEQDNRDDDDEDDPVGNDQEGEESRSNEESALLNMESLTTSLANQLTLWSPTCLDAAWADFADSTDSDDEHEESILGIFMAADLQSCLQNMPNWYDLLKEIISSDNQSVELIFHRLVWMLYNSSEVDPKKQLK